GHRAHGRPARRSGHLAAAGHRVDRRAGALGSVGMEQWAAELGLAPLVGEGGFFAATWRSAHAVEPAGFPGGRVIASAIYFLLERGQRSAWHQLRSDELWFWHRGAPVTLRFGGDGTAPDTAPGTVTEVVLGPEIEA